MRCICTIQQGALSAEQKARIEERIGAAAGMTLGELGTKHECFWIEMPSGSAWTAGKPSSSSIVGMFVPDGMDGSVREPLMKSVCDLWIEITGCSINEIVVSAIDESSFA